MRGTLLHKLLAHCVTLGKEGCRLGHVVVLQQVPANVGVRFASSIGDNKSEGQYDISCTKPYSRLINISTHPLHYSKICHRTDETLCVIIFVGENSDFNT